MHICFASNESWDAESCRRYAEQSLKGIAKNYLESLRTATDASRIAKLARFSETINQRTVNGYVQLFTAEFIGASHLAQESEVDVAKTKLALLSICSPDKINEYSNNYEILYYQIKEFTVTLKDKYFRKLPIIRHLLINE